MQPERAAAWAGPVGFGIGRAVRYIRGMKVDPCSEEPSPDRAGTPGAEASTFEKAALDLEWSAVLSTFARTCRGSAAVRHVQSLVPEGRSNEAFERARVLREAIWATSNGAALPGVPLDSETDFVAAAARGDSLSGLELVAIARLAAAASALRSHLGQNEKLVALHARLEVDPTLDDLRRRLEKSLDANGILTDAASEELSRARRRARGLRTDLRALFGKLTSRYADVLRDAFITEHEGRYALPVRADAPYRIDGIVLGASGSGGTLYIEPREATELANDCRMAEVDVERETARVLGELSRAVGEHAPSLAAAFDVCVEAEVLRALAAHAIETRSVVFDPAPSPRVDLRGMRHPLLADDSVVPIDVKLAEGSCLVVSGPNAGGKTVALKCVGLAAMMVRTGLPIPADPTSHVGWFSEILTDIGDEQSIARSLSTFSAGSARLASYLDLAEHGVLVLLDEVAAGTDPAEGSALAQAILEGLVDRGASVIVTTHYDRLKHLAVEDRRFDNASVGFDLDAMRPTFALTLGRPGASAALAVAERYGIPRALIERARTLLPTSWSSREALIAELEGQRAALASALGEAEEAREQQMRLRAGAEVERARAREQERARLSREAAKMLDEVQRARTILRQASAQARELGGSPPELREAEQKVSDAARLVALGGALERATRTPTPPATKPPDPKRLVAGTVVEILKLGIRGKIVERPDARGRLRVQAGTMSMALRIEEVRLPNDGTEAPRSSPPSPRRKPRLDAPTSRGNDGAPALRTSDNTCDVRGLRAHETEERLAPFIDRLIGEGQSLGFVLHGHGTGALRQALRGGSLHLPGVLEVRAAIPDEGGDAFSVLILQG
jgi:DNA mismatch repair protein MutS2